MFCHGPPYGGPGKQGYFTGGKFQNWLNLRFRQKFQNSLLAEYRGSSENDFCAAKVNCFAPGIGKLRLIRRPSGRTWRQKSASFCRHTLVLPPLVSGQA
jgi:hypothetical protein